MTVALEVTDELDDAVEVDVGRLVLLLETSDDEMAVAEADTEPENEDTELVEDDAEVVEEVVEFEIGRLGDASLINGGPGMV